MRRGVLIVTWILTMALMFAAGAQSQDEDVLIDQCRGQGGDWNRETQECRQHISLNLDIEVPFQYAYGTEPADLLIWRTYSPYLRELRDSFIQEWNAGRISQLGLPGWQMNVDYEAYRHSDAVMTLAFHVMQSTGTRDYLPLDDHFMKTFTFDFASNTLIEWSDLFREGVDPRAIIDPIVTADLHEQLRQYDDDPLLNTTPGGNRESWFALDEDALILFYWSFEVAKDFVARDADPILEVRIPLAELSDVLAPRFRPESG